MTGANGREAQQPCQNEKLGSDCTDLSTVKTPPKTSLVDLQNFTLKHSTKQSTCRLNCSCGNTGETYRERGIRALRRQSLPMAVVLVGNGIDWHRLEAAPADGEYERVARLQQAAEPSVALQAQLQEATPLF